MKLIDLPEDFTPEQFRQLDKKSLDSLPYDILRWNCQCKNCKRGTTVRDYGIAPWYFENRNSKYAALHPEKYWIRIAKTLWTAAREDSHLFCGKHWKLFNRLKAHYDIQHIQRRMLDIEKPCLSDVIKKVNTSTEQINEKRLI